MQLKKLTAKEILEKISNVMSESEFAYFSDYYIENEEWKNIVIPEDNEFYSKIQEVKTARKRFNELSESLSWDELKKHPEFKTLDELRTSNVEEVTKLNILGIGEFEEVEHYGGEGKGDTWYSVKYFPQHDVYIRIDGFYQSYSGVEFYDGYGKEVRPQQKTITVFE